MAKNKSENNIQETDTKVKSRSKKSKVKDEPLDEVKVDVEIDCRSYNHSDVVNGYIRRKRSI